MLDHVGIRCHDFNAAVSFYRAALAPLGMAVVMEVSAEETGAGAHAGFGADRPFFWISEGAGGGCHVAFTAASRQAVDAFRLFTRLEPDAARMQREFEMLIAAEREAE